MSIFFSKNRRTLTWIGGLIWLGVVLAGTFFLTGYANTPGAAGSAPGAWPVSSKLSCNRHQPTFVMFIHPHCPCSAASVEELSQLMAHCRGRVEAHVFFLRPAGMTVEWTQTASWQAAARIPGVTVHRDDDGREARCFGAETSGDAELFDTAGHSVFHGGITAARGHEGDNDGLDAVQALVLQQPARETNTPVFGCSLFNCPANHAP
jgi:hypothetical protein